LTRTWDEIDSNGRLRFVWGEYRRDGNGETLSMGVYLGSDHLVSLSKLIQGIRPDWSGSLDAPRAGAEPMNFITSYYRDGATRTMDAETSCAGRACELNGGLSPNGPFTFVTPRLADLFIEPAQLRVPLILRREWQDAGAVDPNMDNRLREEFSRAVREFAASVDLKPLLELKR
jgi:exosortase J